MSLADIESFFQKNKELDSSVLERQFDTLVRLIGEERFSKLAAQYLVTLTLPETVLPENLKRFSSMVVDGIVFLISQSSAILQQIMRNSAVLVEAQMELSNDFFSYFGGFNR